MLKDWSFHKRGQLATVYEPTAMNWIQTGIAEQIERRSAAVESAVVDPDAETTDARPRRGRKK
jgi:hypothetical protein